MDLIDHLLKKEKVLEVRNNNKVTKWVYKDTLREEEDYEICLLIQQSPFSPDSDITKASINSSEILYTNKKEIAMDKIEGVVHSTIKKGNEEYPDAQKILKELNLWRDE